MRFCVACSTGVQMCFVVESLTRRKLSRQLLRSSGVGCGCGTCKREDFLLLFCGHSVSLKCFVKFKKLEMFLVAGFIEADGPKTTSF